MTPHTNHTQPKGSSATRLTVVAGTVVFAAMLAVGIIPRIGREHAALAAVNDSIITHPIVSVVSPTRGAPTSELLLPGNIQPLYSASVYARVDGYVERRNADIGTKVKAGQILAVISSPEIDQQLLQARATLAQSQASLQQAKAALEQSKANAELTRLTRERDVPLGAEHAISQQIVDEAVQAHNARLADVSASNANITAADANVTAQRANVARLEQMQSFERIVAPFDGVVTERNIERGDLVSATGASVGKPLFAVSQSDTLRIQVDVPQSEAINIHDGQTASVDVKERLGRAYTGTVTRNASLLDPAARTMRTEVQLDNRDGSLLPGMYAQVKFTLAEQHTSLIIPTSALVIDHSGMHVAVVTSNTLHIAPVIIGRDMGTKVEILSGLNGNEQLVASPSDLLHEGQTVKIQ